MLWINRPLFCFSPSFNLLDWDQQNQSLSHPVCNGAMTSLGLIECAQTAPGPKKIIEKTIPNFRRNPVLANGLANFPFSFGWAPKGQGPMMDEVLQELKKNLLTFAWCCANSFSRKHASQSGTGKSNFSSYQTPHLLWKATLPMAQAVKNGWYKVHTRNGFRLFPPSIYPKDWKKSKL